MTVTAPPTAADRAWDRSDAPAGDTAGDPTGGAPARAGDATPRGLPLLVLGEVTFFLVGLAAVIGLRRLFVGGDWFAPLLVHTVAAHAGVAGLRRLRVPVVPAVAAAAAAAGLVISWIHAGDLTTFGFPTTVTADALVGSLSDAFSQFSAIKAPTEAVDGFMIAAAIGIWLGAIVGDWAAFRAGAAIEAVLPSASLFGIAAVLGADQDRIQVTAVWIAAVLAFVLVRRAERLGTSATWVGDPQGRGPRALVLLGIGLALVATAVAGIVAPRLPGARSDAIVSLTDIGEGGPGTRVTVSPLVDIRSKLIDQADVEVFTVRSDARAYWRLTSLDRFDGRIWSSNGSYGKSSGDLDDGVPVASDRIDVTQSFFVSALSQIWLPAAYEPQAVQVDQPVRYDEVSGTLIVDTEIPTSNGTSYQVLSALPQHRPEQLAAATRSVPTDIAERYLALPDDFSPAVAQLAGQLVAGAPSAYDAALRLQNFFRNEFTYDLSVGPGHGANAIESFLFATRRGYCEQFAGSFAAMARSIGLPARVAVGFTPGLAESSDPNLYRVRGEHAHAWPEVYLGEYGWVAFEPTPGRGAPFAEQYTGVPEQQVVSGGDPTTATTSLTPPSTDPALDPSLSSPTTAPLFEDPGAIDTGGAGSGTDNPWFGRIAMAAGVLVTLVALYLLLVLAVTALRRSRRRTAATTTPAQVSLAWEETLTSVRLAGVPVSGAETQRQAADRIGRRVPSIEAPLGDLAGTMEAVSFAPVAPGEETGRTALALADEIGVRVRAQQRPADRFRARFHPRRLRRD